MAKNIYLKTEWENILCSWASRVSLAIVTMAPKRTCRFHAAPIRIPMVSFWTTRKIHPKIHVVPQGTLSSRCTLWVKIKVGDQNFLKGKLVQSYSDQNGMVPARGQTGRWRPSCWHPRTWPVGLWPAGQELLVFLTNGEGRTGYSHAKQWSWALPWHHRQKRTQNRSRA
jgi:hypothetical protein